MNALQKYLLITIVAYFALHEAKAGNGTAVATGYWSSASTWLIDGVARIPACGDTILIPSNDTVTVSTQENYSACSSPLYITVAGTFAFENGYKLQLPCNSTVVILAGAVLEKATPGGGNSTYITVTCADSTDVWNAGMGPDYGPDTIHADNSTTLPISLLYFTGQPEGNQVNVLWSTASEINNNYFNVERSGADLGFTSLTSVSGAGNSNNVLNYSYADDNPLQGLSYYRLKQTDFDGKFTYSPIASVFMGGRNEFKIISANAADFSNLNVIFKDNISEKCMVDIYDVFGKIIFQADVESNKGINNSVISIPCLSNGIYFLMMTNASDTACLKFIKP